MGAEAGPEPGWEGLESWVWDESAARLMGTKSLLCGGWWRGTMSLDPYLT